MKDAIQGMIDAQIEIIRREAFARGENATVDILAGYECGVCGRSNLVLKIEKPDGSHYFECSECGSRSTNAELFM